MSAFRLELSLQTPIILGQHPLSLDGLVWHSLFMKWKCPDKAVEKLADYFETTDGVAHASTLLFGVTASQPLIAVERSFVGGIRRSELDVSRVKANGMKGRYTVIKTDQGPYKNRLTKYRGYHAPAVVFYGAGDGERIAELLQYFVFNLGVECKRGCGHVSDIHLYPEDQDRSLVNGGEPSRYLPLEMYRTLAGKEPQRVVEAQTCPPYRGQNIQMCAAPARIRKVVVQA